jgi:3-dehydroquinate synthase
VSIEVVVPLGERSYPVVVASGGFGGLGRRFSAMGLPRRLFLVTETNVGPLWASAVQEALVAVGFDIAVVTLPAGEATKTTETWSECVDALLEGGIDRATPVVALGGGVLGDIAGFAAATVVRGVPFVQLPTTVLAMVDASVGGKTGVNHRVGKNLVGAFHQPLLVYAALDTLETLPAAERIAGLGEVVKTALIADVDLLQRIERDADALRAGDVRCLAPVIARCVEIKAEVVGRDERESGWRAVLNAGHTLGHAWEAASGFGVLRHGEAVALGLVAETRWALRRGYCHDPELPRRLAKLLGRLGLPTEPPTVPDDRLLAALRVDKKARGDILSVPVAVRAGQMVLAEVPAGDLPELLPEPR